MGRAPHRGSGCERARGFQLPERRRVRANPALLDYVVTGGPGQKSPLAPVVAPGSTGPISFVTPRNPPSFTPADPLSAILPADALAKVESILNNYQASGWKGMTLGDFAYLGDVANQYPAAAPYLDAARQAFVNGYFGGVG